MSLSYEPAYHLDCGLTLSAGRKVVLKDLAQWMFYGGLLEGAPSARTNAWGIENALKRAQAHCYEGAKPFLVPPPRRDFLRKPDDMARNSIGAHIVEWLPQVVCIGTFTDVRPARNPNKDISALTVVWFQEQYALPIQPAPLEELEGLDWDRLATDFEL